MATKVYCSDVRGITIRNQSPDPNPGDPRPNKSNGWRTRSNNAMNNFVNAKENKEITYSISATSLQPGQNISYIQTDKARNSVTQTITTPGEYYIIIRHESQSLLILVTGGTDRSNVTVTEKSKAYISPSDERQKSLRNSSVILRIERKNLVNYDEFNYPSCHRSKICDN